MNRSQSEVPAFEQAFAQLREASSQWLAAGLGQADQARRAGEAAGQAWATFFTLATQHWNDWSARLGPAAWPLPPVDGSTAPVPAPASDRRFAASEWSSLPQFAQIRQTYQLMSRTLLDAVEALPVDEVSRRQLRFCTRQFVDAMSPANFVLTNPEVLRLAMETRGESLRQGYANLLRDIGKGRITLSDDAPFAVGVNLANTPGEVVFENELIQLIQYRPSTASVHEVPLLIIPSVVNKYYLLDLTPESSLVRYLVAQNQTVFMLSWRNVSTPQQDKGWDDYLEQGVMAAIEVTRAISGREQIQAVGYCTGGALLSGALAVLAARGQQPVLSLTLLMTMLDFSDPGELGVFLDAAALARFRQRFAGGGVVPGRELTMTFSSLRANDLIWSFVVNNYLKGRTPDAFDLLYWNSDDSNIAGPMFAWYLEKGYVDNGFVRPGALTMCGVPVDLGRITVPTYVFAAAEDHLVPWRAAYRSLPLLGGEVEFVLGGGGHVTGPVNPAGRKRRQHWVSGAEAPGADPDAWKAAARAIDGSWWPHWTSWLKERAGPLVRAPAQAGSRQHPAREPAPGRYVLERHG